MLDEGTENENKMLHGAIFSDDSFSTIGYEGNSATSFNYRAGTLGDYELIKPLGQGGMGTVYLARNRKLDRLVALKTITRGSLPGPQEIARFRVEAEAAAKLDHPHIASIYEIGESEGTHYISMQFIDGESLDAWRNRISPSPKICAAVVRDIASAMAHAHKHGVVHRDLKPGNIMIDESSTIRIVDFGLAKKLNSESQMTMTGQVMGTPSFMAPEQASGDAKNVTAIADVYAIGAILFYLLTGKPPFEGNTVYDTLDQVQHSPAPSVRTINRKLPLDLSTICSKCLEKSPAKRYASAEELADDLKRFLSNQPVLARRISTATRTVRWCRRNPLATAFMVVTTTMLVATTYLYFKADQAVANAQQSFRRQILTINELLVQIGSADLKNIPNSHAIRRDLLQKAETFYTETRQVSSQYQSVDDLFVQTATQLAAVQGELATTQEERTNALEKLRSAERALYKILEKKQSTSMISIDDAQMVYGLNAELRTWWNSVRGTVDDAVLLRSMRESALTDNLSQQLRLLVNAPETQVTIAKRILGVRSQLAKAFPGDIVSKRRLAGAHHNLAEAYRKLFEETARGVHLLESLDHLELAQHTRHQILANEPTEKIRFEIAKGDYALGSTWYAKQFIESPTNDSTANSSTQQSIEEAYFRAESGFDSLSDSELYSIESRESQAIVLRELSVLNLMRETKSVDLQKRFEQVNKSIQILTELCLENPLVHKYQVELFETKACLYRIYRLKAAETLLDSPGGVDDQLLAAMLEDLEHSKKLATQNPSAFLKPYLALANEVCVRMVGIKAESDAFRICVEAKELVDKQGQQEITSHLTPLIEFLDLVIAKFRPVN